MPTLSSLRINRQNQEGTSGLDSAGVLSLAGSGTNVYESLDSLPSAPAEGSKALVNSVNRLYISDGDGWYNIDLDTGFTPRWDSGGEPDASYSIADSATPLIVTARAVDSDGTTPINQSFVSDSAQYMVTISNDSSVWTFTPKSADSIGIEVGAGNLTESNGDFVYTFKWSDGVSFVSKAVTIAYNPSALDTWFGDRAVMYQGEYANSSDTYYASTFSYVSIDTPSNASDFSNAAYNGGNTPSNGNMSNGIRGVYTEGNGQPDMRYITFATTSSATNFGSNYTYGYQWGAGSASNGIRGFLIGEATSNNSNWEKISYFTIDTTGDATDFGATMNGIRISRGFAVGNATYIVAGAAFDTSVTPRQRSWMGRFTAMTSANASFFGNMTSAGFYVSGCSNETRAVLAGKESEVSGNPNIYQQATETFVIDTTGNASTFGSLRRKRARGTVACNSTIGVYMGGEYDDGGGSPYPSTNEMDYFSMVTAGNSTDFGDLTGNHVRDWAAASGVA